MGVSTSKAGGTTYFTRTLPPVTADLPISSGTALEIDCTGDLIVAVSVSVDVASYWTLADTAALAATNFAGSAYGKLPGNSEIKAEISVSKNSEKLYIISQGAASVGGVDYALSALD